MNRFFEKLMKQACEVLSVVESVSSDGTRSNTYVSQWSGYCNFHTISIQDSQFADKIGSKTAYIVCIPVSVSVSTLNKIKINNVIYTIVGVRDAVVKFERVLEVVKYE